MEPVQLYLRMRLGGWEKRMVGEEVRKVGTSRAWWGEGFYFKLRHKG